MTLNDLQAVRYALLQIKSLDERIIRLRSTLEGCTAKPLSPLPRGGSAARDKLGDDVAKLLELEERRRKQIIDLELKLEGVEMWIESLPALQATVVRMYYVDGKSWRQIGRILNYHPDTCRKIRDAAIRGVFESHPLERGNMIS